MIRGIIFDVDGVILDSMNMWDHLAVNYLNRIGIRPEPFLSEILSDMSMEKGILYLAEKYHLNKTFSEIMNDIHLMIYDFYADEVCLKQGVKEVLSIFQKSNIILTVATSSERESIEAAFQRLEIDSFFQRIYTCTEIGEGKNRPDIFLEAQKNMGFRSEDILVIEDSFNALVTAKSIGMRTLAIFDESSKKYQIEMEEMADYYLKKLSIEGFDEILLSNIGGFMNEK